MASLKQTNPQAAQELVDEQFKELQKWRRLTGELMRDWGYTYREISTFLRRSAKHLDLTHEGVRLDLKKGGDKT